MSRLRHANACLASVQAEHTRPQRLHRDTYEAYQLRDDGTAYPKLVAEGEDLSACLNAVMLPHQAKFVIRHHDALTGETTLRFFVMKQRSKPVYVWEGHQQKRVHRLYHEHVATFRADALPMPLPTNGGSDA